MCACKGNYVHILAHIGIRETMLASSINALLGKLRLSKTCIHAERHICTYIVVSSDEFFCICVEHTYCANGIMQIFCKVCKRDFSFQKDILESSHLEPTSRYSHVCKHNINTMQCFQECCVFDWCSFLQNFSLTNVCICHICLGRYFTTA